MDGDKRGCLCGPGYNAALYWPKLLMACPKKYQHNLI